MKILQVTNRFYPSLGGVETHVLEISKRMVKKGHEVTVLCSDFKELVNGEKYKTNEKDGEFFGIRFKRFWSFRIFNIDATTFPFFLFFWLIFNIRKYDVVHCHTYGYIVGWLPILIGKILSVKVVFTPHYSDGAGISKTIKRVFDILFGSWEFKFANRVIALTKTEKKILEEKFTNKNNIVIIPNGIIIEKELREFSTKEDLFKKYIPEFKYDNEKIIFSIGRLDKRKGHIYLLEAIKILQGKNEKKLLCIIYGVDWGELENLENYIKESNLKNTYIITDMSESDKHDFLEISDLFVLPSLQEAFGIVFLEAMQHGVPCVGTNAGAIKDVILSEYGSLAKVADSEDLSDKIILELSKKRDKHNILNYANKYDWNNISDDILNVYEK